MVSIFMEIAIQCVPSVFVELSQVHIYLERTYNKRRNYKSMRFCVDNILFALKLQNVEDDNQKRNTKIPTYVQSCEYVH